MKMVSIYDLRDNLAELLNSVNEKKTNLIISRHKKPIAMIIPFISDKVNVDFRQYFGFLNKDTSGEKFVNKIRRSVKEKKRIQAFYNRA